MSFSFMTSFGYLMLLITVKLITKLSDQGYHYVYRMPDVYQIIPHGNLDSGFQLGLPSNNKNITLIVEWVAIISLCLPG